MKKIIAVLASALFGLSLFYAAEPVTRKNDDGSISIVAIDKDSSVKTKQKADGFKDVTVVNGKKITKLNPVTVDLSEFGNKEVYLKLKADIKLADKAGNINDIVWMINDLDAGMPVVCQQKINCDEWVSFEGEIALPLGLKKSLYISGAGLNFEDLTFYIRNFEVNLSGDGIGEPAAERVNWKDAPSLGKAYKDYFEFGLATTFKNEFNTEEGMLGIGHHATSITMGNEFKPDFLFAWKRPGELVDFVAEDGKTYQMPSNLPVFKDMDMILRMAKSMGIKVRGHVLVWHSQTPEWFFKEDFSGNKNAAYVDAATMTAREEWYIKSVLTHVKEWEEKNNNGKRLIYTWDVVNEAVADGAGAQKWLREDSDWYRVFGDETFILNAFRFANKYAPEDVLLVYNDYNTYTPGKRNAICNLIDEIKAIPDARIDAVGMQSHIKVDYPELRGTNSFEEAIQSFLARGVDVQITELDIANGTKPYSSVILKARYKEVFKICLENRKVDGKNGVTGVTVWGLNDAGTWLNHQKEYLGHTQYPLLFNADWTTKPAFYGVLEAAESVK